MIESFKRRAPEVRETLSDKILPSDVRYALQYKGAKMGAIGDFGSDSKRVRICCTLSFGKGCCRRSCPSIATDGDDMWRSEWHDSQQ